MLGGLSQQPPSQAQGGTHLTDTPWPTTQIAHLNTDHTQLPGIIQDQSIPLLLLGTQSWLRMSPEPVSYSQPLDARAEPTQAMSRMVIETVTAVSTRIQSDRPNTAQSFIATMHRTSTP